MIPRHTWVGADALLNQVSGSKPTMSAIIFIFGDVTLLAEKAMDRVQRTHVVVLLLSLDVASVRRTCGRDPNGSTGGSRRQIVGNRRI
jgi:hypothetical protein